MSIIHANRTGLFSSDYRILRNGADLGLLDLATVRSRATFTLSGIGYELRPEGLLSGRFVLEAAGRAVGRVDREQLLPVSYRVRAGDRQLTLQSALPGRQFAVRHGDRTIGTIRPRNFFTRNAVATYHEELPAEFEIFLLALVLLRWRRRSRAARS